MVSLDAPAPSFSLSQTTSDICCRDRNPALLCTDIADCWLRKEYSVRLIITKLEQVVTHRNAILFQLVYSRTIYRSVCLFLCIKLQLELYAQCCLRMRCLTISNKLWENHDLTLQPVITYIYLCEWISASCLSSLSNCPSVMDQKLNRYVTQALEKPFKIGIFPYTDSWCLAPFSSNISRDRTRKVCFG
jgi:hypothetical protein